MARSSVPTPVFADPTDPGGCERGPGEENAPQSLLALVQVAATEANKPKKRNGGNVWFSFQDLAYIKALAANPDVRASVDASFRDFARAGQAQLLIRALKAFGWVLGDDNTLHRSWDPTINAFERDRLEQRQLAAVAAAGACESLQAAQAAGAALRAQFETAEASLQQALAEARSAEQRVHELEQTIAQQREELAAAAHEREVQIARAHADAASKTAELREDLARFKGAAAEQPSRSQQAAAMTAELERRNRTIAELQTAVQAAAEHTVVLESSLRGQQTRCGILEGKLSKFEQEASPTKASPVDTSKRCREHRQKLLLEELNTAREEVETLRQRVRALEDAAPLGPRRQTAPLSLQPIRVSSEDSAAFKMF